MIVWLSPDDVAAELQLSLDAARDLMHDLGAITVRRRLRLRRSCLDEWIARNTPEPAPLANAPRKREVSQKHMNDRRYIAATPAERQRYRRRLSRGMSGHYPGIDRDLLELQGGTCALCPAVADQLDHDHANGQVRGLLCGRCNLMLGYGRESPEMLSDRVMRYLGDPPARRLNCTSAPARSESTASGTRSVTGTTLRPESAIAIVSPRGSETTGPRPAESGPSSRRRSANAGSRLALIAADARRSRKRSPSVSPL